MGKTFLLTSSCRPLQRVVHNSLFTLTESLYFSRMDLAANLASVRERIAAACARANRDPASVTLLAVTKTQPPEVVNEAARLGLSLFGENKIQEAKSKIPLCSGRLRWHMIGHLQSNKARDAVGLFSMVQSVDSLHLAEEMNKRAELAARTMPILLEVNIVGEARLASASSSAPSRAPAAASGPRTTRL